MLISALQSDRVKHFVIVSKQLSDLSFSFDVPGLASFGGHGLHFWL
jgi:hypothetical protein